ncbi:UNKNOWN [Stylonychia lemnae]|uniref:Uncharacterized protein n=1 Tax=Stylonychia lemnae TaxID=5949 RepID=A0A077ZYY7_STYLE|nr:UNKNOWN [Stylonychia lemnae]|eukprot:CDW73748.1 UNKNOWN [Stylonychia lemnae]
MQTLIEIPIATDGKSLQILFKPINLRAQNNLQPLYDQSTGKQISQITSQENQSRGDSINSKKLNRNKRFKLHSVQYSPRQLPSIEDSKIFGPVDFDRLIESSGASVLTSPKEGQGFNTLKSLIKTQQGFLPVNERRFATFINRRNSMSNATKMGQSTKVSSNLKASIQMNDSFMSTNPNLLSGSNMNSNYHSHVRQQEVINIPMVHLSTAQSNYQSLNDDQAMNFSKRHGNEVMNVRGQESRLQQRQIINRTQNSSSRRCRYQRNKNLAGPLSPPPESINNRFESFTQTEEDPHQTVISPDIYLAKENVKIEDDPFLMSHQYDATELKRLKDVRFQEYEDAQSIRRSIYTRRLTVDSQMDKYSAFDENGQMVRDVNATKEKRLLLKKSILLPRGEFDKDCRRNQFIQHMPVLEREGLIDNPDQIVQIMRMTAKRSKEQDENEHHLKAKKKTIVSDMNEEEIIQKRIEQRQKFQNANSLTSKANKECCQIPIIDNSFQITTQLSPKYLQTTLIDKIKQRQGTQRISSSWNRRNQIQRPESVDSEKIKSLMNNDKEVNKEHIMKLCRQEVSQLLKTKLKYRDLDVRKRVQEQYFDKLRMIMTIFPQNQKK